MNRRTLKRWLIGASLTAVVVGSFPAAAQEFPTRPITFVVPYPAGTIADLFARTLGNELAPLLKQPVVVENKAGAFQIPASSYVAGRAPDGYTLMISVVPTVIPPQLRKNLPFNRNADFETLGYIASLHNVLTVSPSVPANTLAEFIALLKANPGKYMYGSAGVGSAHHLALEAFNHAAGTSSVHVPYKAFQNIITDVAGGTLQYSFLPLSIHQLAATGKVKILGSNGLKRDPGYPDLKTLNEQGLANFEATVKYVVLTTKGTPAPVVSRLNEAINAAIATEAFANKLKAVGGVEIPKAMTPGQVRELLQTEDTRAMNIVRERNIALD